MVCQTNVVAAGGSTLLQTDALFLLATTSDRQTVYAFCPKREFFIRLKFLANGHQNINRNSQTSPLDTLWLLFFHTILYIPYLCELRHITHNRHNNARTSRDCQLTKPEVRVICRIRHNRNWANEYGADKSDDDRLSNRTAHIDRPTVADIWM